MIKTNPIKIIAAVLYVAVIAVNYLANALPINGRGTGQISDQYSNLFTPAGLTFSIWGLIYLLLFGYIIYQFGVISKKQAEEKAELFAKINPYFILSSLANIAWIFAWHYDYIALSLVIMLILLFSLIKIADITRSQHLGSGERFFISLPFSVYFGWITVATIANVTIFLISIGWSGFGLADHIWTIIVLFVGALIGLLRMLKDRNVAYILVFVWAYLGILIRHISGQGFAGQYPGIITALIICLVLFLAFGARLFYQVKTRTSNEAQA